MNRRRRLGTALGLAALTVGVPATAHADAPVRMDPIDFSFVLPGLVDCGDVALDVLVSGQNRTTDRDGVLSVHVAYQLTWVNPLTGESLSSRGVRSSVLDEAGDGYRSSGAARVVTVPGEGVVLHSAGHIVETYATEERLFTAGPDETDETLLCGYLT